MDGLRDANSLQARGKTPLRKQIRVAAALRRAPYFLKHFIVSSVI
jgi:hypothetical protein